MRRSINLSILLVLATIFLSCAAKVQPQGICPPIAVPADARKTNPGDFPPLIVPEKSGDFYLVPQKWMDDARYEIMTLKDALKELVAGVDVYNGAYTPKKEVPGGH